jgi:EAL domain-containing protein (putative c-di-GMP-specific phosphodiesterase class I)/CheY-like chemotaxis protein
MDGKNTYPAPPGAARRRVLIADDEPHLCRALGRALTAADFETVLVHDGNAAIDAVVGSSFDVILSDIRMPGPSGIDLLRVIRAYDLDVPVVLMTGNPEITDALEAVELGALQYLCKPFSLDTVVSVVERASRLHRLAGLKREALSLHGDDAAQAGDVAGLGVAFDRALDSLWMAYQPIVSLGTQRAVAYEALLRTEEPALSTPTAMIGAAERLDRVSELGRRIRLLVAERIPTAPDDALVFVNLHAQDMLDPDLVSLTAPLSAFADRVVLEITERAALSPVREIEARAEILRFMGFRIALDDLGAGYAGLTSFATLEPEFVKLDMSLIRGIHASEVRQRLVGSVVSLCGEMKKGIIAEGIEVGDERDRLQELGCDWMQGYLFARPSPPFTEPVWD